MPARIETLIDKQDTFELVRDQIAAILKLESIQQQNLAVFQGKGCHEWGLRVFLERPNPWEEFGEPPEGDWPAPDPIVNVSFDNMSYDGTTGNHVEQQKCAAVYHLDCYGIGYSTETLEGPTSADEVAALASHRAIRLVRNILMSAHWSYLGMRGVVAKRWPQSVAMFQPEIEEPVQSIAAGRIAFRVEFNEFSPQHEGQPIELISTEIRRASDGEILLVADFPTGSAS